VLFAPGVHSVLPTPFAADESLDEASVASLVDYYAGHGVAGVLALGALGEADRLSDRERERVQAAVLEAVAGRVDVTIGVAHQATVVAAARARGAERAGATAVMVSPPLGVVAGPALRDHFRRVADGLSVPVVVQDFPAGGGAHLPVEFLADLADVLPPGSAVKQEEPPTAIKTAAIVEAAPGLRVFGGLNGVSLLAELEAGASGTITGVAPPSALVEVVAAHAAGDRARARAVHEAALPLLTFTGQPGVGLLLRKEILRRAGAIASATVRAPAARIDGSTLARLDELLEAVPEEAR
jgi:4-hydroxy-tetrahydrodipicolinate synthase